MNIERKVNSICVSCIFLGLGCLFATIGFNNILKSKIDKKEAEEKICVSQLTSMNESWSAQEDIWKVMAASTDDVEAKEEYLVVKKAHKIVQLRLMAIENKTVTCVQ